MINKYDIGWHRLTALKELTDVKRKHWLDKQVFLSSGLKVNIEYFDGTHFYGQIINVSKGIKQYAKHDIVQFDESEIVENSAKVIEFKTEV